MARPDPADPTSRPVSSATATGHRDVDPDVDADVDPGLEPDLEPDAEPDAQRADSGSDPPAGTPGDDVRDALPDDLDAAAYVGPYDFPDNSRRRKPAVLYLVVAVACLILWIVRGDGGVLVNNGFLIAAIVLAAVAAVSFTSGWRMHVDEKQALVAAQGAVGFPVGHASAQQVWRGVRSRPTWRVLVYSAEDPPRRRGLVIVDAVDGTVYEHIVQDNPPDAWDN